MNSPWPTAPVDSVPAVTSACFRLKTRRRWQKAPPGIVPWSPGLPDRARGGGKAGIIRRAGKNPVESAQPIGHNLHPDQAPARRHLWSWVVAPAGTDGKRRHGSARSPAASSASSAATMQYAQPIAHRSSEYMILKSDLYCKPSPL